MGNFMRRTTDEWARKRRSPIEIRFIKNENNGIKRIVFILFLQLKIIDVNINYGRNHIL